MSEGQDRGASHIQNWPGHPTSMADSQVGESKLTFGYTSTLARLCCVHNFSLVLCSLAAILRIRNRIYSRSIVSMGRQGTQAEGTVDLLCWIDGAADA